MRLRPAVAATPGPYVRTGFGKGAGTSVCVSRWPRRAGFQHRRAINPALGPQSAGSNEGSDNWAVIDTLIENCKISGVNPHTWLTETLAKLANGHPANAVGELMPWIAVA